MISCSSMEYTAMPPIFSRFAISGTSIRADFADSWGKGEEVASGSAIAFTYRAVFSMFGPKGWSGWRLNVSVDAIT
jgi:hypothetical protein